MPRSPAIVLGLVVLTLASILGRAPSARASPRSARPVDEQLGDGDIDAEDLVGRATVGRGQLRSSPGGDAWLSLSGFTRETVVGEREVGGMLVLGLPLDRFARVSARAGLAPAPIANAPASTPPIVLTGAAEEPQVAVTPRLARATVEASWRAAGLGNDDARLDAIVSRARWSAVLPETRLRATRFDDQRLYSESTADVNRLRDSAGANVGLEARLTWRFDRLLYADDEPSFERMRLERHDARARIAGRVLEALFHWHRAGLELRWAQAASREARQPPRHPTRDEAEAALRVMEAEATLDVLTGGWFTVSRARFLVTRPVVPAAPTLPQAL
jgi:hypothetical protein